MTPGRPLVAIYTTGGTIASTTGSRPGVAPRLTADELVAALPALADVAELRASSFRQVPSPGLRLTDLGELLDRAREDVESGAAGVVVTQGTDTLEETAFVLDLLWDLDAPVIVTGAMRNAALPGADGPANLLASVQVAASRAARGLGALVVFNDEIHAPRYLRKTHTTNPSTFRSWAGGPLGWITEGRVRVVARPVRPLVVPSVDRRPLDMPPVALVKAGFDDDGRLLGAVRELGFQGLVVEATGGGHLQEGWVPVLEDLARDLPVVLASRTGGGELLRETYGFPGSEADILARGVLPAGALDGLKARLLLGLLLAGGAGRDGIAAAFENAVGPA
jgi:L-asparaginase